MGQLAGVAQITASLPTSEGHLTFQGGWRARWCALVQSGALVAEALERRLENPRLKRMRAVSLKGSIFFAIPSGSIAALTLPGVTMTCLIERGILTSARRPAAFGGEREPARRDIARRALNSRL
jgi:hypothetical protein